MISIIIPVYNMEDYLRKCLDSVLAQTFTGYEVIIINDGSTDKSPLIAQEFANLYPDKIRIVHKENGGLGDARNVGIELAQGEYLLFLDSDDYISHDMLELLNEYIVRFKADLYIYGFSVVQNDKVLRKEIDPMPYNTPLKLTSDPKILLSQPNACNKIFRRELFVKSGVRFPVRVWFEDIRVTVKLYNLCHSIVYLNEAPYFYVKRKGSITNNENCERNIEILEAFDDIILYFREQNLFEKYYNELEFLAIYHALIAASVRVLKLNVNSSLLGELINYLSINFPSFHKNPYLLRLSRNKRIIYNLLLKKQYKVIRNIFKAKDIIQGML